MQSDAMFSSGGARIAAWVVRPDGEHQGPRPVVVMAHGFSLTRHDGLLPYARAFAEAGVVSVVFDHRFLGDSGGEPRQRFRRREQLADWRAAVAFARELPGVDRDKVVLWGFSFSGGHVVTLAQQGLPVAAVLALCPFVDGLARVLVTPPRDVLKILPPAIRDLTGRHATIPVTAPPGAFGAMTLPGEYDGFQHAAGGDSPWRNEISPALFLTIALVRPVTGAAHVTVPLWVGRGERDISVHGPAVAKLAARAPRGELHDYPYDHFEPFLTDAPALIAADQIDFLRRTGVLETTASHDLRGQAIAWFNETWRLLEQKERSTADDDRMLHLAHASRFAWGEVGGPMQIATGEWQCARVYAELGRSESALHHSRRCLSISLENDVPTWLVASAYEGLARSASLAGDATLTTSCVAEAEKLLSLVDDPEDAAIVRADLATIVLPL